ncbi:serine/arginine repetitive matrix protein 1-like [Accipiter gentilis]|uniref:serine/arginine repetitive matrix protein 1-like n=1 Tax=Astur gentilis TaxID=8957 RepID=UPI00210FB24F|nr:serine/arginine repetitive matrix protein 1-like [Accipiter gentilis]
MAPHMLYKNKEDFASAAHHLPYKNIGTGHMTPVLTLLEYPQEVWLLLPPRVLHRQRSGAHAEAGDGGAPAAPSPPPAVNGHPSGGAGREHARTRSAAKEKESESGGKRRRGGAGGGAARYTPACPPATDLPKPVRERAGGRAAARPPTRARLPPSRSSPTHGTATPHSSGRQRLCREGARGEGLAAPPPRRACSPHPPPSRP